MFLIKFMPGIVPGKDELKYYLPFDWKNIIIIIINKLICCCPVNIGN